MTYNACVLPEAELMLRPPRSSDEIITELKQELSQSDLSDWESDHELVSILYYSGMDWGSDAHKLTVVEALASPKYSDAYRRYFAAVHLNEARMFSVGDPFFTEELIFSVLQKGAGSHRIKMEYFKVMMGSAHLSERIMEAALEKNLGRYRGEILTFAPDAMVTPKVIRSWLSSIHGPYQKATDGPRLATKIRQAHPEYEGFPDEWVLKVFCGQ